MGEPVPSNQHTFATNIIRPKDLFNKGSGFLLLFTNLKDGRGDPIAGHNRLRVWSAFSVKVRLSDFWENLGLAPPIGSNQINISKNIAFLRQTGSDSIFRWLHGSIFTNWISAPYYQQ